jgi:7-cyano-7-deazaguanine synthase in queuosine biosynthesis
MKSTTFLCGLDRRVLLEIPRGRSDAKFVLQVGHQEGNIVLAPKASGPNRERLSPLAQDLVEIGCYLHQSDRLVERDPERWSRTLRYDVAVSDVDRWQAQAPLLGRIASFLSGDRIRFDFHPKRHAPTWSPEITKPEAPASSITLYSGGLDSSSGMCKLFSEGARTVAVTQYSNRLQDRASLLRDLAKAGSGDVPLVAFRVVPRRTQAIGVRGGPPTPPLKDVENTWRLRTFLYLALAGAVADTLGIDNVLMFENGILAHNLPFDSYVIGARSTRHAHPTFLLMMEQLFAALFQRPIAIRNPFQFMTKGFEAGSLAQLTRTAVGRPSFVARTNSCWNFPNQVALLGHASGSPITHCGACMPCKIRRLAVLEAGLEEWEPIDGQYFLDPLAPASSRRGGRRELAAYDQHARNLRRLHAYVERINRCDDLQKFASEWPQIIEFEGKNLSSQPVASVPNSIFCMYRIFACRAAHTLAGESGSDRQRTNTTRDVV